jgi:hypothetical protein
VCASNLGIVPGRPRVRPSSARCLTLCAARPPSHPARQLVLKAPPPAAWRDDRCDINLPPVIPRHFFYWPLWTLSLSSQLCQDFAVTTVRVSHSIVSYGSFLIGSVVLSVRQGPHTKGEGIVPPVLSKAAGFSN